MNGRIIISKLDVARRQLETAIRLFFYAGDAVSIHTLAAAAFNVLNDLCRQDGKRKKSIREEILQYVKEEKQKYFIDKLRETENFNKHADRDPTAIHSFDPKATMLLMFDAARCYSRLTGEFTVVIQAYFLWFMTQEPDVFVLPEYERSLIDRGSQLLEGIPEGKLKQMFFEGILPLLAQRGHKI